MQLIIFSELAISAGFYAMAFMSRGIGVIFEERRDVGELVLAAQRKAALLFFTPGGALAGAGIGVLRSIKPGDEFFGTNSPIKAAAIGATLGITAGACIVYGMQAAEQSPMLNRFAQRNAVRTMRLR